MRYSNILLISIILFLFYLFHTPYSLRKIRKIESMTNYNNNEYFYINNANINNEILDQKRVEMWAKPYIDFSPCDHGYRIFPRVKKDY